MNSKTPYSEYAQQVEGLPARFVRLVQRCWDQDPEQRPSFDNILSELQATEKEMKGSSAAGGSSGSQGRERAEVSLVTLEKLSDLNIDLGISARQQTVLILWQAASNEGGNQEDPQDALSISMANAIEEIKVEAELLSTLHHENIIRLMGVVTTEEDGLYLAFPLCRNGSLHKVLHEKRHDYQTLYDIVTWMRSIAKGLAYLHGYNVLGYQGIIHRDVKSANILMDTLKKAKSATLVYPGWVKETSTDTTMRTMGTPRFMAPEVITGLEYNEKMVVLSCTRYSRMSIRFPNSGPSSTSHFKWQPTTSGHPFHNQR
ncbi:hypothetical protein PROFUN_09161 [Planoprotostelium fungivorum]|uniref:Protein kinase domain-containing protein n=1 Tax=Planoprotostelium fungivorum TaxID=1890364 RepID=A0A2P6MVK7_9EUKA|nr:hypothetical protein PROFUN_09161 [Planoprotostelium fungivorum]